MPNNCQLKRQDWELVLLPMPFSFLRDVLLLAAVSMSEFACFMFQDRDSIVGLLNV
jgi:hypothetical protein